MGLSHKARNCVFSSRGLLLKYFSAGVIISSKTQGGHSFMQFFTLENDFTYKPTICMGTVQLLINLLNVLLAYICFNI